MYILLIIALLLLLVFGPQWWARYTFRRYADALPRIPGTGGELARHLLDRFEMPGVAVEKTDKGDHYDPESRTVRLSPDNYNQNSLTAVAVAAHEVGHAIQHQRNETKLALRHRLVKLEQTTQQLGAGAMFLMPVAVVITRAPASGLVLAAIGFAVQTGRIGGFEEQVAGLEGEVAGLTDQLTATQQRVAAFELERKEIRQSVSQLRESVLALDALVGAAPASQEPVAAEPAEPMIELPTLP